VSPVEPYRPEPVLVDPDLKHVFGGPSGNEPYHGVFAPKPEPYHAVFGEAPATRIEQNTAGLSEADRAAYLRGYHNRGWPLWRVLLSGIVGR
jgi:hypothetical protein